MEMRGTLKAPIRFKTDQPKGDPIFLGHAVQISRKVSIESPHMFHSVYVLLQYLKSLELGNRKAKMFGIGSVHTTQKNFKDKQNLIEEK